MSSKWIACTLGDVLTLQRGYDLPERDRREGTVPIVSSSGVSGFHDTAKVKAPGVVTGRYGTLGQVFYVKDNFWPHNTTLYVRDFKGNEPLFISYFLRTLSFAAQNAAGAVPGVNRNALHLMPVKVPLVPVQRRIAAILSAYDDLIENNTRRIKILEAMAQMLYREWFVEFHFPGHEDVKLNNGVPEGWGKAKLSDAATVYRGRSYRGQDLAEKGGLPFLNLKCIERDGGFRYNGVKRYLGDYKPTQTARAGDIIMAVTDMTQERRIVARAARVPQTYEKLYVLSMDLVKIAPSAEIPAAYLYSMLRFSDFPNEVKQHANGVNVLHLSPERIEEFQFVLPLKQARERFGEIVATIFEQCDSINLKNVNLRRTRDLLLPRLVSGEVDVADLEIALE